MSTSDQLEDAFDIRREVFIGEQNCEEADEFDGLDSEATHLLALRGGAVIGTLRIRLLEEGDLVKIERVAVVKHARSQGVGARLVDYALEYAIDNGCHKAKLHAQVYATGFYTRHGFESRGKTFVEDGIEHIAMYRPLGADR